MDEIAAWLYDFWQSRAEIVGPAEGGCGILTPTFRFAHDHNRVMVREAVDPTALMVSAEQVLEGYAHRLITTDLSGLADQLEKGLAEHGYERDDSLVLEFVGRAAPAGEVEELDRETRAAIATQEWRRDQPDWSDAACQQLGDRCVTAQPATWLGIRGDEGQVVARVDLYQRGDIAQVEELMTDPAYQGRGYASRLVLSAVARAQSQGARRVFIIADVEDWPKELYRKLGFADLGTVASFSRSAPA